MALTDNTVQDIDHVGKFHIVLLMRIVAGLCMLLAALSVITFFATGDLCAFFIGVLQIFGLCALCVALNVDSVPFAYIFLGTVILELIAFVFAIGHVAYLYWGSDEPPLTGSQLGVLVIVCLVLIGVHAAIAFLALKYVAYLKKHTAHDEHGHHEIRLQHLNA